MHQHPYIAATIARQRQAELIATASRDRLAREARRARRSPREATTGQPRNWRRLIPLPAR